MRPSMISNEPKSNSPKTWSAWNSLGKTGSRLLLTSTICASWTTQISLSQTQSGQSLLSESTPSPAPRGELLNLPSCEALDRLQLLMSTSAILKLLKPEMPQKLSILLCRTSSEPSKPSLSDEDKNDQ